MKDMKGNLWEEMKDNPLGPSVWKPLENAAWSSDAVREDMMLPLKIAYSDLSTWHPKRLGVTATGVAVLTVTRILAEMPLPEKIRNQCRNAMTQPLAFEAASEATLAALEPKTAKEIGEEDPGARRSRHAIEEAADQMSMAAMWAAGGAPLPGLTLEESAKAAAKAADAAITWGANPDDVLREACRIWVTMAYWAERQTADSVASTSSADH
jgi:hypothetical protein